MSIKLDLHIHSEARGKVFINAKQLEDSLRNNRLDGVAITNFNDISHALWLKEKLKDFIVIVGQEMWTEDGHIVGLGLRKRIDDFKSAKKTIELIHAQGGLSVAVHPFLFLGIGKKMMTLSIDAVESYNAGMAPPLFYNHLAKQMARKLNLPQLASTDTTNARFIGRSYTEVMTEDRSSILQTIRSGKVGLFKRALPFPYVFMLKSILGFRDMEPCLTHASPCLVCKKSITLRLFKKRHRCLDCGRIESSRIACCNGHYICMRCVTKRGMDRKYEG